MNKLVYKTQVLVLSGMLMQYVVVTPVFALSEDPPRFSDVFQSVDNLSKLLFPVGVFLSMIMLIWGGYMWIMSTGDPQKLKQAQGVLTWAILGLVFIVFLRVIVIVLLKRSLWMVVLILMDIIIL